MKAQILVYILAIPLSFLSFGQNRIQSENFYVQKITVEDGLSQSNVNAIIKDSDGFIWLATNDGLNRFDGYSFKVFNKNPDDSLSISDNKIWCIFEDSKKRLWIGTNQGGLCLYNKEKEQFTTFNHNPDNTNSLCQQSVYSISEDHLGRLWIATQWGLSIFDYEKNLFVNRYVSPDGFGITNNYTNCVVNDQKGHMLLGTKEGMSIINIETLEIKNIYFEPEKPNGLLNGNVQNIFVDSKNNIWVVQEGYGTSIYDIETNHFTYYFHNPNDPHSINSKLIRTMSEDKHGNLLFGTDGNGLSIFDTEKQKFYQLTSQNEASFQNTAIYDLYIDDNEKLWIGTYGEGVKILDLQQKGFEHVKIFGPDMPKSGKKSVLSLAEDHKGNIWIGTDGSGLYKYNPTTDQYTAFLHDENDNSTISSNVIKTLCVDHNGNIYAGTYSGGLNYINTKTNQIKSYLNIPNDSTSIPMNNIWYVMEDSDHRIWLGTLGKGLSEFLPSSQTFKNNNKESGLPGNISNNFVSKIIEGDSDILWIATEGGGVNKYNKQDGSYKWYLNSNSETPDIINNDVKDLYQDLDGNLWAMTNGGGLNKYNPDKDIFEKAFDNTKLPSSVVAMLEDNIGNYWVTSYSGLYKIDKNNLSIKTYNITDGLQGNEFNINSKLIDSRGKFYFGGLNGFTSFHPEKIKEINNVPPIILTNLLLFHKKVEINDNTNLLEENISFTKSITLQPDQSVISFEYAALNYDLPNTKTYAYILEGFDSEWNYVGNQRLATYTNLPAGKYVFKAKTTDNEGKWSDTGLSIELIVIAPWHERLSFKLVLLFALLLLVAGIIRIRTQFLLRQKKRLEQMVKIRTEKIENQKFEIEEKNKKLHKQNEKIKESHAKISFQNDELIEKNTKIIAQREQLDLKSKQLGKAHDDLKTANKELIKLNNNLEQLVEERTQELQKTIEKLVETDAGLNTFLYRSSHDLRGPITTLLGLVHLAKLENKEESSQKYYNKIQIACNQMLRFLKKLRETNTIFRIDKKSEIIDWDKLIKDVKHELSAIDPDNSVKKTFDLQIKSKIKSDASILKTILLHLLENSIVFNTTDNPNVNVKIFETKQSLEITLTDNGIGIPSEIQSKIFEMFFRGSELSNGNGLGLFLVKKAVEIINGKLTVHSKENSGTTFKISIPQKITLETKKESKKLKL